MTELLQSFRKLTVALDAAYCAQCDWESASELAQMMGAELEALFVEDIDLLKLAALPFAREVGHASGQDRPIARESMESMLRRRVKHAEEQLARAGKRRNVAVTHATERGKVIHRALAHGAEGDVLLLRSASVRRAARGPRARPAGRGTVMLWYEEGPLAQASCELAVHLARQARSGLVVGYSTQAQGDEGLLRERLGGLVSALPGPMWAQPIAEGRVDLLMEVARAQRVSELVLSGRGEFATPESIERICDEDRLELIIVR
jgi:hypothetical protein